MSTWNNIEINKLTKTVVSSVSHADATALSINIDGVRFTGVAGLDATVDTFRYERVLVSSWESCGTKSLTTSTTLTETIGTDRTTMVGGKWKQSVTGDLLINGKFVCIGNSVKGIDASSAMVEVRSKNEVNISAANRINCSVGDEGSGTGLWLQYASDKGTVTIIADNITFQAKEQITLRAPKVVTQGASDQLPYDPVAYEMG